ncbi:Isochorismatase [Croceitalea dokdonensis DOKDO 023]|uniref:Isochorismatase n=2 Tax=Croceitalea TaxID=574891 RepID=A0A0P7AHQ8_9FLAO|nr:Isochorismatase [Croceitalea dokdonensis DOKDO 023]
MEAVKIKEIAYSSTWPIRHKVMWPDKALDYIKLPKDLEGKHFGAFRKNQLVGVVSVFMEQDSAQFRKLAVLAKFQGKGYGKRLLQCVIDHCKAMDVQRLWCNARKDKIGFYLAFDMVQTGQEFSKGGTDFEVLELKLNTMSLKSKNTALLMVDVQKGFENEIYWGGNRNNKNAEENCGFLLKLWRDYNLPIFHIKHASKNPNSPLHPTKPGFAFHSSIEPLDKEPIIVKDVNSAFIGTDLEKTLGNNNIGSLVVVGLTTNHCISTTVRMAGNLGFETFVISDATATFDRVGVDGQKYSAEVIHQTTLASLHQEFATVLNTQQLTSLL